MGIVGVPDQIVVSDEVDQVSRLVLFKLSFGNVLIFQVAARPRDSLREFQSSVENQVFNFATKRAICWNSTNLTACSQ